MSLAVVINTAAGPGGRRTKYAIETVEHLRRNLAWIEPVWWHIADDGSPPQHRAALHAAAAAVDGPDALHVVGHWTVSDSGGRGYGASVNAARDVLAACGPPEFLLMIEDDWRLTRPIDLAPMFGMLRELDDVGMVRLSYIAWTKPLFGLFRWAADHQWLELRRDSEEPFIFSGNPRLEHWHFLGDLRWANGIEELKPGANGWPGEYELDITWKVKTREAGHRTEVVYPVDFLPAAAGPRSYFQHFGTERSFD